MARLVALIRKEFIQIGRDRRTLAMMILLPLVWLIMFGYAFNFDVREMRVAVVDRSGTRVGELVAGALRGYERFRIVELPEPTEAGIRLAMHRNQLQMGIIIPPGYGEVKGGDHARLRVLVDGADLFAAQAAVRLFQGALEPIQDRIRAEVQAAVRVELRERIQQEMAAAVTGARQRARAALATRTAELRARLEEQMRAEVERRKAEVLARVPPAMRPLVEQQLGSALALPQLPDMSLELPEDVIQPPSPEKIDLTPGEPPQMIPEVEILYNPELRTANVMIPGLLGMVTMFMTTLMTALGIVREREYGTLEQLVVTPLRPIELMLGKLLPYVLIAAVDFALVFLAGTYLFDLRFAGNLPLFLALSLLFLITTLSLGLLISTLAQNQQQAMQLAFFAMFPQILLSGLIFPLSSMPKVIQYLAYLLPFTYYVPIARGMFIKGQELALLATPAWLLAAYALTTVTLASLRFRKRLG